MKALVIADNEKVIKRTNLTLEKFGYDTIVYRWLLKALDNIEEISPHLIIISTKDYPRHWKTLTQFSCWSKPSDTTASSFDVIQFPQVILIAGDNFSDEERDKANTLNVAGIFNDDDGDGIYAGLEKILSDFDSKLNRQKAAEDSKSEPCKSEPSEPEQPEENKPDEEEELKTVPCSFVFTNPITLALVSGAARNFNGKTLEFTPDIPEFIRTLSEGTSINAATLRILDDTESTDSIKSVTADVISNDTEHLVLKITA